MELVSCGKYLDSTSLKEKLRKRESNMIREIIKYPTKPSLEFGGNVRHFNEELVELIEDLKETAEANGLDGLSAFEVGSPLSVFVVKNADGVFIEIINPRMIKHEGSIEPIETTTYFPGLSAKTKRYEKIKIMYENRNAEAKYLNAEGDFAVLIQQKMDYIFGSNFRIRMSESEKKIFDKKLEYGTDTIVDNECPTEFKRDKILKLLRILFISGLIGVFGALFVDENTLLLLKSVENYIMIAMLGFIIIYFFYAQYEGKLYKSCTSCQIGNIVGISFIEFIKLAFLFLINYFFL
jgi:peptide deformylase